MRKMKKRKSNLLFRAYSNEIYDDLMIEHMTELLVNIVDNIQQLANSHHKNEQISNYDIHVTGFDVRSNAKDQLIVCFKSMLMNFYHNHYHWNLTENYANKPSHPIDT